jgi:thiosulfate/3-mercaptopyruvate sulfurtransferase
MSHDLVSTDWLAMRLNSPDIVIIDASWHLPAAKRNAKTEFEREHIPGARFYDLDAGSDPDSALPHMFPTAEKFAKDMIAVGLGAGRTVVVYDSVGLYSSPRLWWMLKTFGHKDINVLDGGLPKWRREGHPLEAGKAAAVRDWHVKPKFDPSMVKSMHDVTKALASGSAQIADARSRARFRGEELEPRPGVKPGHMPGAINVHYASLLNPDGTLKKKRHLQQAFKATELDMKRPIITSCGSGVTAAIVLLALTELDVKDVSLYDGSWAEWGASGQPIVTG